MEIGQCPTVIITSEGDYFYVVAKKYRIYSYKRLAFILKMMVLSRCLNEVGVLKMLRVYLIVISIIVTKVCAPRFGPAHLNQTA